MKVLNKMNCIIIYSMLALLCAGISSCSDDFLTPKPLSTFMPENTYTNKEAMTALLNDCRYYLKQEHLNDNPLICTEYNVSDICVPGETVSQSLKNLDTQLTPSNSGNAKITTTSSSDAGLSTYWIACWSAIKSANTVITRNANVEYDVEADGYAVLAEGYFHRAYWYYRIIHQYGEVPFLDGEITAPTVNLYTASREKILRHLVSDMEYAVQWLPKSAKFGEVSQAAGYHLLTKLYLATNRFDDAINAATEVIENSGLALMTQRFGVDKDKAEHDVMWDLFRKENISIPENTEGILVTQERVEFGGTLPSSASSWAGTQRTRHYSPFWIGIPGMTTTLGEKYYVYTLRGIARSRPVNHMNYDMWSNSEGDLRHTWPNWFPTDSLKYNNPISLNYGKRVPKSASTDTLRQWFPWQYYKIYVPDEVNSPYSNTNARGGFTDIYIFRLAETYLLRAEAYWWKGNLEAAKNDINSVRGRANAPLIDESDVSIDYILDERARELYVEEPRKTELTRIAFIMADQGRDGYQRSNMHENNFYYDRVMRVNNFFATNYTQGGVMFKMSPYHYLWPIPQNDIDANVEGRINQNYGYPGYEYNVDPIDD